jgi:hypothetical protein
MAPLAVLGRSVLGFVGASSQQPAVKWQTAAESGRRQLKVLDRSNKTHREDGEGAANGFVAAGNRQPAANSKWQTAAESARPVQQNPQRTERALITHSWQPAAGSRQPAVLGCQCSAGSA